MRLFADLLDAFSQDVTKKRYASFAEVMEYCRRSANPVGRLLLHLFKRTSDSDFRDSDAICSALQLVNFWQDVELDWVKDNRVYLPQDEMARFGVTEQHLSRKTCDEAWRSLMKFQVDRARELMLSGARLGKTLAWPRRPRNPRHHAGRAAHPREDRARRLRRVPPPADAAPTRLAGGPAKSSMTPDEYCQQKAAASGSSFYYSFLFLPPDRRRAITALYAFCREVDDVVDETSEREIAAAKLGWWRSEVANLFAGNPQHPVTQSAGASPSSPAASPGKR